MAVAEIGEGEKNAKTPIAVTAFLMKHYKLQELFSNLTGDCPDKHNCKVTCADTHVSSSDDVDVDEEDDPPTVWYDTLTLA